MPEISQSELDKLLADQASLKAAQDEVARLTDINKTVKATEAALSTAQGQCQLVARPTSCCPHSRRATGHIVANIAVGRL